MKWFKELHNKFKQIWWSYKHPGRQNTALYSKYVPEETFNNRKVLNLGCGFSTYGASNVINMDLYPAPGVNLRWDANKTPYPFEDNTFDFIIANHILEHLPNWWEAFKELSRILKVGGTIEIWLPGDGGSSQQGYRDHVSVINYVSFNGIRGTQRNNCNAWEREEQKKLGCIKDLKLDGPFYKPMMYWWVFMWPNRIMMWLMIHLRNLIMEEGYFFTKLPPLEQGEN